MTLPTRRRAENLACLAASPLSEGRGPAPIARFHATKAANAEASLVARSLFNLRKARPRNMRLDNDEGAARGTGILPEPHRFSVRVYYEDTDFSGVVYHASYLRFLERGRTEFLRALGIEHKVVFADGGSQGFHFVVRAMAIDFARPALMDDALVVETCPAAVGGASIEMAQRILRGSEVLVTARVRIALVSEGKARRLPRDLAARLGQARSRLDGPKVTRS